MNKGIGMATGDVIGFLNADDYYQDENVLKAIARAFAWHGTDAVHGNLHYINGVRDTVRTWARNGIQSWILPARLEPGTPHILL